MDFLSYFLGAPALSVLVGKGKVNFTHLAEKSRLMLKRVF